MTHAGSRRAFLRSSFLGGTGLLILSNPKLAFGTTANSKLHIAGIGVGGQGRGNLDALAGLGENLVALCDVDQVRAGDIYQKHPKARRFTDYRRMLDEADADIDAVMVATPDHTHAVAAVDAMLRKKHVYCEKPLTRTVREARVMRETALAMKVATQMGNQGSASDGLRRGAELVLGGAIGEVREAHVWFDGGNGPLERPADTPPVPATLSWDLWLGPAEARPYHPSYLPGSWRGWRAFGSGIVGDFGCHTANLMFRALRLNDLWNAPRSASPAPLIVRVEAHPSERNVEGYPSSSRITLDLPARGELPPVKLTMWAKEKPPVDLMLGYPQQGWGDLLVGAKGSIYSECPWNTRFTLLPENRFTDVKAGPPQVLPKPTGHHREWVQACKGEGTPFSPFEIGGPMTELMQLANLATLVEGPLDYDIVSGRILNNDRAQQLTHREYREGWRLG
ncbi:MAG TPA: Gfo/Idh/MocA family oxidoreductase [Verrucomicrobiota bacterium]|nr:Gfo/Idh/MocA family oxidoreductase [Verrucomicrobiota bacterium]HRZ58136.1 Gfo/Idh/MocA family oxidoreductase [Candidatus Paceibacterota bacterium]